jgi:hypothetical protein
MSFRGFKQAVYNGFVLEDYYVDGDGRIISTKRGMSKVMTSTTDKFGYGKLRLTIGFNDAITVSTHRVVCETFHEMPASFIPEGISQVDWAYTPDSVKRLIAYTHWQVNHIDHDKGNNHPSNLEWTDRKENARKYQEHKRWA